MQFRTEITPESSFRINHRNKTLFTGSCFTNNIGLRLFDLRFPVIVNPFGVVYNPLSVFRNFELMLDSKVYTAKDLRMHDELWFSFDHHSSFSDTNRDRALDKINTSLSEASDMIFEADYLLITFGTAWVYRLLENGRIVCNCHKMPAKEFSRELLTVMDITEACEKIIARLAEKNPGLKIIFTVSPVRHWKDGAHGNQVSKATLLLAVDEICKRFPEKTGYFPAYELLLDDLRDYRFYADDLVHPSEQAMEYIWEKFSLTYFTEETRQLNSEIEKIIHATRHRIMFSGTGNHRKFVDAQLKKIMALQKAFPYLNLIPYVTHFESQLTQD